MQFRYSGSIALYIVPFETLLAVFFDFIYYTTRKLISKNVLTIGDLARIDPELLQGWFGKNGIMLWRFANGEDTSRIMPNGYETPIKSVGHGITCSCDLHTNDEVWKVMLELSQDIGHRLRTYGLAAKGVRCMSAAMTWADTNIRCRCAIPAKALWRSPRLPGCC